jgi:2-methylcitrate dehydratase PrpD
MKHTPIENPNGLGFSRRAFLTGTLAMSVASLMPLAGAAHASASKKTSNPVNRSSAMTKKLAQFVADTNNNDIPAPMYEHAKIALLDTVGVLLAGKEEPVTKKLLHLANFTGGKEQSTVIGHGVKKSVTQAALINGAASHALDFDDTSARFWGHPSCSLFPSLLALGELEHKSGRDLLAAYLIGLEVGFITADSVGEEMYRAGFHNTGTLGIVASGAGCARLLGLDKDKASNALAIAATQNSGLKRSFGTMCKPFHAGNAAEGAVMAALLAKDGFTGADDIFEGPNGLLIAYGGSVNDFAMGTLGRTWGVEDLFQKYHAACNWIHSPIEAALAIKQKNKSLRADNIKSIQIITSDIALATADVVQPRTGLEGKFSIPYCVASALESGNTGISAFTDEAVNSQKIKALIAKTKVSAHPKAEPFDARVIVETADGYRYSHDYNVMENIPTLEEKRVRVRKKFIETASPALGLPKTEKAAEMMLGIDGVNDVSKLLDLVKG